MGEGNEQTPVAIIKNAPKVVFQKRSPTTEEIAEITIEPEDDLYAPVMMSVPWDKAGDKT
jgi:F420-0:gamma-glutamyl ligase